MIALILGAGAEASCFAIAAGKRGRRVAVGTIRAVWKEDPNLPGWAINFTNIHARRKLYLV